MPWQPRLFVTWVPPWRSTHDPRLPGMCKQLPAVGQGLCSWIRKLLGIHEQLCWLGHKKLCAIKGTDVQGRLQEGRDDFRPREALVSFRRD